MSVPPPNELHLSVITHLRFPADWTTREHSHAETNEMILILGGEMEVDIQGQTLRGPAGSVLVYPRGIPHAERAIGGPLHMMLAVWSEKKPSRSPQNRPVVSADRRGRIREMLEWLHEVPSTDRSTLSSLLHCALVEFERGTDLPHDDPVSRVQRHIHQNFAQKITLTDLAKIAHQSPYHFARLFHQRTGLPPMRYLRQVRVEAAKTLVVTSPLPLRAIALMSGLVDEFHLSRVFRAMTGRAPSALRRGTPMASK